MQLVERIYWNASWGMHLVGRTRFSTVSGRFVAARIKHRLRNPNLGSEELYRPEGPLTR